MARKLARSLSRRRFIGTVGAGSLALLTPSWAGRLTAAPDPLSKIFHVGNVPDPPFLAGGNLHAGIETLLQLMHGQGLPFYRSAAAAPLSGAQGLIAAGDVVLLKVNAQWKYRGCTNSDVVRGLVERVLRHPDGFRGEVVIVENGQSCGSLNCDTSVNYENHEVHANAVNESHSFSYLIRSVFADPRVSGFLFDPIRSVFIAADDHVTDGYRRFENVSYPCFTTSGGRRVELREGIWTGSGHAQNLKLLNVPVLKHHDAGGSEITAALKHVYGLVSMLDGSRSYRHYLGLGETCGKMMAAVRPPVLNVIDAIWVSHLALKGYPASATRQLNALVASQDPVALDYWAAKHVLFPIDGNPRHHPDHENIQRWLQAAEATINGRGGLYHPEWGIAVGAVTRDESRMAVHSASASPLPALCLLTPNGGESWARGAQQVIRWSVAGDAGDQARILLLRDGLTALAIARSAPVAAGEFRWTVPADMAKGNRYRLRIVSRQHPGLLDDSDGPFSIGMAPPGSRLDLAAPNGGESWKRGTKQTIRWTYAGQPGTEVSLFLLKAGQVLQTVAARAPLGSGGAGSFSWAIPLTLAPGRDYAVRIRSAAYPDCRDQSAKTFSVVR